MMAKRKLNKPKIDLSHLRTTLESVRDKHGPPVAVEIIRQTGKANYIAEIAEDLYPAVLYHAEAVLSGSMPLPVVPSPPSPLPPPRPKPRRKAYHDKPPSPLDRLNIRHGEFLSAVRHALDFPGLREFQQPWTAEHRLELVRRALAGYESGIMGIFTEPSNG